jgi:hypothetical protein
VSAAAVAAAAVAAAAIASSEMDAGIADTADADVEVGVEAGVAVAAIADGLIARVVEQVEGARREPWMRRREDSSRAADSDSRSR